MSDVNKDVLSSGWVVRPLPSEDTDVLLCHKDVAIFAQEGSMHTPTPEMTTETWECVDNHGHYFTTNSLTAIGQHVIAFWLLADKDKQNNESKGETDYEHAQGSTE